MKLTIFLIWMGSFDIHAHFNDEISMTINHSVRQLIHSDQPAAFAFIILQHLIDFCLVITGHAIREDRNDVVYLNPIEMIWDEVREKGFCNEIFKSLEAVLDRLCATVKELAEDTQRVASITHREWLISALTFQIGINRVESEYSGNISQGKVPLVWAALFL